MATESGGSILKVILSRRMLVAFVMGFACGLLLLLTMSLLQAWMKEEGVDLTVIGMMALVGLPYTLKFVWSPLLDRFTLPFLGRRRGWLLATAAGLAVWNVYALGYGSADSVVYLVPAFVVACVYLGAGLADLLQRLRSPWLLY